MKIIYNCFAGISGDMNLAAMLDLGMDPNTLKSELSKLGIDDEFELEIKQASKSGIHGTQVNVNLKHHHHKHDHGHGHEHGHEHHHHSRNYEDISTLIDSSTLNKTIKDLSKKIFWEVAVAEGKVHNKTPEEVHFHEVGATDSIVDIVGAAICYYHMGITHVISTKPELGGGFVKCQHGKMPVPAPATVEILHGIACTSGAVQKEMTTPTGAAILKVLTDEWLDNPQTKTIKTAYGIGHRDVEIPNVLRVFSYEEGGLAVNNTMIECNIDDMTAEDLAQLPDLMIKNHALDAYLSPIIMKKGRPGTQLSVLCKGQYIDDLCQLIFEQTSTIGLRFYEVTKVELTRNSQTLISPWGEVKYKESILPNGEKRVKFEYEDVLRIAKQEGISLISTRQYLNDELK